MRRALMSGLVSGLLTLSLAGSAAAVEPASIDITSATVVAKGAAVNVQFDIICDGGPTRIEWGFVQVQQRARKNEMAWGQEEQWAWGADPTCDGSTRNHFSQLVYSGTDYASGVPFKNGEALVRVYAIAGTWPSFTDVTEVVKLKRSK